MDIKKTNPFAPAEPIKNMARTKGTVTESETHTAIEKMPSQPKDQGPQLGKLAGAISEINLMDDHQPLHPCVEEAIQELAHGSNPILRNPEKLDTLEPFADREAKMAKNLLSKLNEKKVSPDGKGWTYTFSNADLKEQINALRAEVKQIMRQREMGMTDCWGGMTNRQVACEAAIRALESCLKERSQTLKSLGELGPKPQICGPFPWEDKFKDLNGPFKPNQK